MRRIILPPNGARLESPGPISLGMEERLWEQGYSRIVNLPASPRLHRFWQHYYGATAEMDLSGSELVELRLEILAALPQCQSTPELQDFLRDFAALCHEAHRRQCRLQVIAD